MGIFNRTRLILLLILWQVLVVVSGWVGRGMLVGLNVSMGYTRIIGNLIDIQRSDSHRNLIDVQSMRFDEPM